MRNRTLLIIPLSVLLVIEGCKVGIVASRINPIEIEQMADAFYSNPSGITGIGDPYIVKHRAGDEYYYLYATHKTDGAQAWKSKDLKAWE